MTLLNLLSILFVCLLAEGFFTGTELAIVSVDKLKLKGKARQGSAPAKLVLSYLEKPGRFFSSTLLGTNLAVVTSSVCTTYYIVQHYGPSYAGWALALSPILLVFGEIVPKSLYQHHAEKMAYKTVYVIKIFGMILFPIVAYLTKLNDIFLGKASRQFAAEPPVTREELEALMKEGLSAESPRGFVRRTLISKIFDLADKKVLKIMKPLVDVKALSATATHEEIPLAFEESGHSRLPVFQGRLVNITGLLYNIDYLMSDRQKPVSELMRPAYFVPEEMSLDDLFLTMKRKGEQMAIVVDEFGGAVGIVTLEDVLEEVVGDIQDEYDKPFPLYYRMGKNRLLVSGRLEIREANEKLHLNIPEGDYETIAGFLIHQLGFIPKPNTEHRFGNLNFLIRRATEKMIQDVEIRVQ